MAPLEFVVGTPLRVTQHTCGQGQVCWSEENRVAVASGQTTVTVQNCSPPLFAGIGVQQWVTEISDKSRSRRIEFGGKGKFETSLLRDDDKQLGSTMLDWSPYVFTLTPFPSCLLAVVTANQNLLVYAPPKPGLCEQELVYNLMDDHGLVERLKCETVSSTTATTTTSSSSVGGRKARRQPARRKQKTSKSGVASENAGAQSCDLRVMDCSFSPVNVSSVMDSEILLAILLQDARNHSKGIAFSTFRRHPRPDSHSDSDDGSLLSCELETSSRESVACCSIKLLDPSGTKGKKCAEQETEAFQELLLASSHRNGTVTLKAVVIMGGEKGAAGRIRVGPNLLEVRVPENICGISTTFYVHIHASEEGEGDTYPGMAIAAGLAEGSVAVYTQNNFTLNSPDSSACRFYDVYTGVHDSCISGLTCIPYTATQSNGQGSKLHWIVCACSNDGKMRRLQLSNPKEKRDLKLACVGESDLSGVGCPLTRMGMRGWNTHGVAGSISILAASVSSASTKGLNPHLVRSKRRQSCKIDFVHLVKDIEPKQVAQSFGKELVNQSRKGYLALSFVYEVTYFFQKVLEETLRSSDDEKHSEAKEVIDSLLWNYIESNSKREAVRGTSETDVKIWQLRLVTVVLRKLVINLSPKESDLYTHWLPVLQECEEVLSSSRQDTQNSCFTVGCSPLDPQVLAGHFLQCVLCGFPSAHWAGKPVCPRCGVVLSKI